MIPGHRPKSQQQGILLVTRAAGRSGLPLAAEVAQGLSPACAQYDIVGSTPRGVVLGTALSCDRSFFSGVGRTHQSRRGSAINRAKTTPPMRQEVRLAAAL